MPPEWTDVTQTVTFPSLPFHFMVFPTVESYVTGTVVLNVAQADVNVT
jgi:hypothetical protein